MTETSGAHDANPDISEAFRIVEAGLEGRDEAILALAGISSYVARLEQSNRDLEEDYAYTRQRNEVLFEQATTDEMTGLPNRRAMLIKAAEGPLHKRHQQEPLHEYEQRINAIAGHWVGFVDLDKFKSVNDTYGHAQGDRMLKLSALGLRLATRPDEDEVYRVGGDEFVVVISFTHPAPQRARFHVRLDNRLKSAKDFLLSDEGAEYLERVGFGRLTDNDRRIMSSELGWTIGGYYVEGPHLDRIEAINAADAHMLKRKSKKDHTR
jgi:diguanylate cyclase (GGDEF)-like protein